MSELEIIHSPERESQLTDPIACLLRGESLVGAGRFKRAATAYNEAGAGLLTVLEECSEKDRPHLEPLAIAIDYSVAELARVWGDTETARSHLYALRSRFTENPFLGSPFVALDESLRIINGFTYIIARSDGFLRLSLLRDGMERREFAETYYSLLAADEALAAGVHANEHILPLPPPPDKDEPDPDKALRLRDMLIKKQTSDRRQLRRSTDPGLAIALHAAASFLNRDGIKRDRAGIRLPWVETPKFTILGPRASMILGIDA